MKLSSVKVDSKGAEAGEWVTKIPDMEDLALKVRGAQCASARAMRAKLIRELPLNVRNNPDGLPPEVRDSIDAKVAVEVLLLDWKNVEEGAYSKELATRYMTDPDYVFFQDAVYWAAMQVGRQAAANHEAALGNSPAGSGGS